MDKKLIYIAGALRNKDVTKYLENVHKMIKFAEKIRRLGFAVFVPCEDVIRGIVMGDMSFGDFYDNSMEILKRSDGVCLVPGWESSNGTHKEIAEATRRLIPIFEDEYQLVRHFRKEVTFLHVT